MSTENKKTVVQVIASAMQARANCIKSNNDDWYYKWTDKLESIQDNILPSGSGIDSGCTLQLDDIWQDKITIFTEYHHMNEVGYYTHWTKHKITVYPNFDGIRLSITGKNDNGIKDYLYELFDQVLTSKYHE